MSYNEKRDIRLKQKKKTIIKKLCKLNLNLDNKIRIRHDLNKFDDEYNMDNDSI